MSSSGHVLDMIIRMKNNAESKKAHNEHRREIRDAYLHVHHNDAQNRIREACITNEKLERIKEEIRELSLQDQKSSSKKTFLISGILTVVLVYLSYVVLMA